MNKLICTIALLIPVIANAGNSMDMQLMMQKAQEMQACMQNVDQDKMQVFQKQAQQMGEEIKSLCAAGNREQAQAKAMVFSKKIAIDSSIQEMKKCAEIMKGMLPDLMDMAESFGYDSKAHVCDN